MTRLKLAELTTVVGVLVLGLGLGALLSRWVGSAAGPIAIVGVAKGGAKSPAWVVALYLACWVVLAALLGLLLFWTR